MPERWLFRGVDVSAGPGSCVALVGANGAGKSTLLRCLYGIEPVTEGTVTVAGGEPEERSVAFRRRVSVLLDDSDTFAELTPRQHVELLLGTFGVDVDMTGLLDEAGLAAAAGVPAEGLSAGQQRRLLLLGATARPYEVLLLDEPERALDEAGREWLAGLLTRAKRDTAVVIATHDDELVTAVADGVVGV